MKVTVNFQPGKTNVKGEMINNDTSVGQRKNLSPDRNWTHEHWAGVLSTELRELMESEAILCDTRPAYC